MFCLISGCQLYETVNAGIFLVCEGSRRRVVLAIAKVLKLRDLKSGML